MEEFMAVNFPKAECISDFYHAALYVHELSRALGGPEEEARSGEWCHVLKHEGAGALLSTWEELAERCEASSELSEVYGRVRRYVEKNRHRMDYPRYRREGLWIGSGSIEAGCKHVANQRMKQSGMRWGEKGASAMGHVRAAYRSTGDHWDTLWPMNHPARVTADRKT